MTSTPHRITRTGLWIIIATSVSAFAQTGANQPTFENLQKMDLNKDGKLSYEEISKGFSANQPRLVEAFKARDANGNGVIDKGELPAVRFGRMDLNKDGSITSDEFLIGSSNQAREFVLRADTNRDGMVTSDELGHGVKQTVAGAGASYEEISQSYYERPTRRKHLFFLLDADKSGSLGATEWPDAQSFSVVDANRDGQINEKEFLAAHAQVTAAVVSSLDTNKDGRVTLGETRKRRK